MHPVKLMWIKKRLMFLKRHLHGVCWTPVGTASSSPSGQLAGCISYPLLPDCAGFVQDKQEVRSASHALASLCSWHSCVVFLSKRKRISVELESGLPCPATCRCASCWQVAQMTGLHFKGPSCSRRMRGFMWEKRILGYSTSGENLAR